MFDLREKLSVLDSVSLNLGSGTGIIMSVVLALIMFGIALNIKPATMKNVFVHPRSILTGLFLQWIGLPALTFLLIMIFGKYLTPMVALGLILVSCCPGGNISNFMSSFSKGNVELSVSMTAVSTVFSPVVTPFNFWLWGNMFLRYADNRMNVDLPYLEIPFSEVFRTVFIILAIPIVLGILFAKYCPNATKKINKPFSVFSLAVFAVMVLGMFIPNWQIFIHYIFWIVVIVFVHNASAFALGYFGSAAMRLPEIDRRSLTIEVGIQNSGLGLTLLLNPAIFNPQVWNNPETGMMYGGMLFVTAWWGIWHIISGLTVSSIFRHSKIN